MSAPIVDIEDLFRKSQYKVNPRLTKTSVLRPTKRTKVLFQQFQRNIKKNTLPHELLNDFSLAVHSDLTEEEAVQEAARCLKCADAPVRYLFYLSLSLSSSYSVDSCNYFNNQTLLLTEAYL